MQERNAVEQFVGVDFHKETTVVTRLRADGSRIWKTEYFPSTHAGLAELQRRVSANQGNRKNAGRIAVARQLLVSIFHMLKRKEGFRPERIGKVQG